MSLASSKPPTGGQSIPRLAEPFEPTTQGDMTPRAHEEADEKKKKRGLFGFGKKKNEEPTAPKAASLATEVSPTRRPTRSVASPIQTEYPRHPSSPGRGLSSSPRLASPAGSQIFERDVQESAVHMPNSPAIPSHITTENYIPPVLDAAGEAITDNHLSPDNVEILTHSGHQPASVTVTGVGPYGNESSGLVASWADELAAFAEKDHPDSASNYGSFDTTDVRRLSFISFADVVQSEQAGHGGIAGSRDSMYLAGLTSLASVGVNRSPSPIRSPVSSAGMGTSPPTSKSGSIKGLELSPSRKPLGSPTSTHGVPLSPGVLGGGEVNVETMSQALRRTGSTDLSAFRSVPTSPV
ncbi:hypothetical protein GQ53DRAFT_111774 [Thozetella sp. PMI_491]|nr:hypothetical protein GQ53DRAFT_111774 [Thozetella sp. PMI_491]